MDMFHLVEHSDHVKSRVLVVIVASLEVLVEWQHVQTAFSPLPTPRRLLPAFVHVLVAEPALALPDCANEKPALSKRRRSVFPIRLRFFGRCLAIVGVVGLVVVFGGLFLGGDGGGGFLWWFGRGILGVLRGCVGWFAVF